MFLLLNIESTFVKSVTKSVTKSLQKRDKSNWQYLVIKETFLVKLPSPSLILSLKTIKRGGAFD
jgi:hypothetical protein